MSSATSRTTRSASSRSYGRPRVRSRTVFIALNGEAGYEPEVLRGGLHLFLFPFMYRIHKSDLVTVGQGKIAYVFAA